MAPGRDGAFGGVPSAGAKPLIERLIALMNGGTVASAARPGAERFASPPATVAASVRDVPAVGPRAGSRRHDRKALFGHVLVGGVAYAAPELAAMIDLEAVLVWTHRDDPDAVVATSDDGPFFAARRVTVAAGGRA